MWQAGPINDLKSGGKIDDLVFPSELVYARFSDDGKKLFILTRNQNYYLIDSEGFALKSYINIVTGKQAFCSWSGGKDSCLALKRALADGL